MSAKRHSQHHQWKDPRWNERKNKEKNTQSAFPAGKHTAIRTPLTVQPQPHLWQMFKPRQLQRQRKETEAKTALKGILNITWETLDDVSIRGPKAAINSLLAVIAVFGVCINPIRIWWKLIINTFEQDAIANANTIKELTTQVERLLGVIVRPLIGHTENEIPQNLLQRIHELTAYVFSCLSNPKIHSIPYIQGLEIPFWRVGNTGFLPLHSESCRETCQDDYKEDQAIIRSF